MRQYNISKQYCTNCQSKSENNCVSIWQV